MAATDVVAYTFNADTHHPTCVLIALGYSQRTAETLAVEDELDALAEDRSVNRMDQHSFDSEHFPKVIFESDLEPCYEDGRPYSCGTCGQNLDPDYVAPFHWAVRCSIESMQPGGVPSCHDNPDAARAAFVELLTLMAGAVKPCPHATAEVPDSDDCSACLPRRNILHQAALLDENPHEIGHDTEQYSFTADLNRRGVPAVRAWVERVPSYNCEIDHDTEQRAPVSGDAAVIRNDPSVGAGVVITAHTMGGDVANAWSVLVAAVGTRDALVELRKRCDAREGTAEAGERLYLDIRQAHNL